MKEKISGKKCWKYLSEVKQDETEKTKRDSPISYIQYFNKSN